MITKIRAYFYFEIWTLIQKYNIVTTSSRVEVIKNWVYVLLAVNSTKENMIYQHDSTVLRFVVNVKVQAIKEKNKSAN